MRGRELYLKCPNGIARTNFTTDHLDRTLRAITTVRNWCTTMTLAAMARDE
ncbi:MAG: hypothetical protein VYE68_02160 [Acidobacteriota bacterium]|nr:hypothetical protein [Acidobacteriota bacterium]